MHFVYRERFIQKLFHIIYTDFFYTHTHTHRLCIAYIQENLKLPIDSDLLAKLNWQFIYFFYSYRIVCGD